jgi:hypothetical protein
MRPNRVVGRTRRAPHDIVGSIPRGARAAGCRLRQREVAKFLESRAQAKTFANRDRRGHVSKRRPIRAKFTFGVAEIRQCRRFDERVFDRPRVDEYRFADGLSLRGCAGQQANHAQIRAAYREAAPVAGLLKKSPARRRASNPLLRDVRAACRWNSR